jgi:sec-independent protein translocase protein TatB
MFNLGAGEIAVIMIVALLLLGPEKLPELARGIGKLVREFRRQTDDVRGMVEREFYKMDQEVFAEDQAQTKQIAPPAPSEPSAAPTQTPEGDLAPPTYPSVFPPPEGVVAARSAAAAPLTPEAPPAPPTEPAAAPASEPAAPASGSVAAARPEGDPAPHG